MKLVKLLLTLIALMPPIKAMADPTFTISGSILTSVDMHGESEAVIPDGVECIRDYAFRDCYSLTTLTIPASVTAIGGVAFEGCYNLSTISFVGDQPSISSGTFDDVRANCIARLPRNNTTYSTNGSWWYGLAVEYYDPNNQTKVKWTIRNGELTNVELNGETDVTIPSSVTHIGNHAFSYCHYDLKSVIIPDSVTCIGANAFSDCRELASVVIGSGVTRIEWYAFSNCGSLKSIFLLRNSLPTCDSSAFDGVASNCVMYANSPNDGLKDFNNWGNLTVVEVSLPCDSAMLAKPTFTVEHGELRDVSLNGATWMVIPGSATHIRYDSFRCCNELTGMLIPSSVTEIDSGSFSDCQSITSIIGAPQCMLDDYGLAQFLHPYELTDVVIAPEVTTIGDRAFDSCYDLDHVTMAESLTNISDETFQDCWRVEIEVYDGDQHKSIWEIRSGVLTGVELIEKTAVTVPNFVTVIGPYAFDDCHELTDVTIGDTVCRIDSDAFQGCYNLKNVIIGSPSTKHGNAIFYNDTFANCYELTNVTLGTGWTQIGEGMFRGCHSLVQVNIPTSITYIGDQAFQDCESLVSVTIPDGVTSIGECTFMFCRKLSSVNFGNGVKSIGDCAFESCTQLTNVIIPSNVTSIGAEAFCNSGLTHVTIPDSVTNIGYAAFMVLLPEKLYDMTTFNTIRLVDGWAVECLKAPSGHLDLSGVRGIADKAFASCSNLTSVMIHSSMTNIGNNAFTSCGSLSIVYVEKDDAERVRGLCAWPSKVTFVEFTAPIVTGDVNATVSGDAESGLVIKPSDDKTSVELSIPVGMDAAKVTVEVSPTVERVAPNGANIKIARNGNDITAFLNVPSADGDGVVDLTKASVKEEIVRETMDPEQGAVIDLNSESPSLTTRNTRKGLVYKLREGAKLGEMQDGDSTIGDGLPWSPTITVKGGDSAFYSISVEK